jgi:hypothetical protein
MNYRGWRISRRWNDKSTSWLWFAVKRDRSRGIGPFASEAQAAQAVDEIEGPHV